MSHFLGRIQDNRDSSDGYHEPGETGEFDGWDSQDESADILNAHRTYLLRVAGDLLRPELRPKVSPSDLVQESIIVAIRKFQSFHGSSPHQLRSWMEAILRRRYCNLQRVFYRNARHAIGKEVSIEAARAQNPAWEIPDRREQDAEIDRIRQLEMIRHEVRKLTPAEADVFVLRMEQDFPVDEIARRLGISEACVHKRYQRAVRHLFERIHNRVDSDSEIR